MKLIDFYIFEPFNNVKASMGIPRNVYGELKIKIQEGRLSEMELERLTSPDGLEIKFDQITILPDGTLSYKNSRVILYIRDVATYSGQNTEPKFHISNCATLQRMRSDGKFNRYVISTRIDGQFTINRIQNNKSISQLSDLKVCQNCLAKLNFDGFSGGIQHPEKKNIVQNFKIGDFFNKYPMSLFLDTPQYNSDNSPINAYPKNWNDISRQFRERAGWRCNKCLILLREQHLQKFLDVHHKNGLKFDCRDDNLEAICIGCHAEEPDHAHMKVNQRYNEFIQTKNAMG